jgi:hypothetical protein
MTGRISDPLMLPLNSSDNTSITSVPGFDLAVKRITGYAEVYTR